MATRVSMPPMTSIFDVSKKHIHVTGASSGLGQHFSTLLAGLGARVSFSARRVELIDQLATDLRAAGGEAFSVPCDVTSQDSILDALTRSEAEFGPVDALINNAGASIPGPVLDMSLDDWSSVLKTNLDSVWIASQEAARRAVERDRVCSIVNIASIAGIRTYTNVTPYVASKAGVIGITKNMAIELARTKVRINAIAPGFFDTELGGRYRSQDPDRRKALLERIPMGRVGRHNELNGVVLLLVSDASSYMTGTVTVVDGGHSEGSL